MKPILQKIQHVITIFDPGSMGQQGTFKENTYSDAVRAVIEEVIKVV